MSIQEHLNKIRNAVYGHEVRESIAKGIETAYDDASENGNANMEVKVARGTHPNLRSRLEEVDNKQQQNTAQLQQTEQELSSQLAQKAQQTDLLVTDSRIDSLIATAGDGTIPSELTDIRVGADGLTYTTAGGAVREQFSCVNVKLDDINPVIQNKNFMTDGEIIEGYWIDSTGVYKAGATSKYIKIKVKPGENISFCRMDTLGYSGNVMGGIVFVDSTGNIIEIVDIPSNIIIDGYLGYNYLSLDVPLEAKELHFTVKLSSTWDITSTAILIKEETFDNYDPNDIKVTSIYNREIADIKARNDIKALQTGNYYSGVKWVAVGDSLTEVNSRATTNYVGYLTDELGFNSVNMGVSGTGYKRQDDLNNAFYQRISTVPTDADVVTIFGSFNDLGAGVPLGTKDDVGTDTLGGAINTTIDNLYSILPTVPLGIIAPTPWIDQDLSNQTSTSSSYVKLLHDICFDRGVPFLDLFHSSGLRPWDSEYRTLMYSRDAGNGVHPDENGHRLFYPQIREFIKTLL